MGVRDDELLKRIGQRIRALREARGLSQYDLEADSNISRNQIARIERGELNSSISTFAEIAKGLNIELSELFVDPSEDH